MNIIMEPVNIIRAPSLKRGKIDEKLCDRVCILNLFNNYLKNKLVYLHIGEKSLHTGNSM